MVSKDIRVLVVGQTPPPFGGQAVMIDAMLQGAYEGVRLYHVRMAFSDDMDSIGRFKLKKVWVLFNTVLRIWWGRIRWGTRILYYPPAGPNTVPVIRDIILLTATRWLFAHTIFHFHAGGVSSFKKELPALLRPFFSIAYRKPSLAVRTSSLNPDDGQALDAARSIVVPNGIKDMRAEYPEEFAKRGERQMILFTGILMPSKGVREVLKSFKVLVDGGHDVGLWLMGRWHDREFPAGVREVHSGQRVGAACGGAGRTARPGQVQVLQWLRCVLLPVIFRSRVLWIGACGSDAVRQAGGQHSLARYSFGSRGRKERLPGPDEGA